MHELRVLSLPVEASSVGVKFPDEKMFPSFEYVGIWILHHLQNTALHICHRVASTREVFTRRFTGDPGDIIAVLRKSLLEAFGRLPYIFTVWVIFAVKFVASPVIETVLRLTVH